jgi:hypothetical protein
MTRRQARTVGEVLLVQLGWRRTIGPIAMVVGWSLHRAVHHTEPTIEELADDVGKSLSQVYRWQADFRQALGPLGYDTPGDLLDAVEARARVTVPEVFGFQVAS